MQIVEQTFTQLLHCYGIEFRAVNIGLIKQMTDPKNVLILCTGNSARSIMGEALITKLGGGKFLGHSAGSQPTGKPNPFAIKLLKSKGYDTSFARSKIWDEFSTNGAPRIDYVFTVCDSAAAETCPVWIGTPLQAHWGIPDPASATGSDEEILEAFEIGYNQLERRIAAFFALDLDAMDSEELRSALSRIGRLDG